MDDVIDSTRVFKAVDAWRDASISAEMKYRAALEHWEAGGKASAEPRTPYRSTLVLGADCMRVHARGFVFDLTTTLPQPIVREQDRLIKCKVDLRPLESWLRASPVMSAFDDMGIVERLLMGISSGARCSSTAVFRNNHGSTMKNWKQFVKLMDYEVGADRIVPHNFLHTFPTKISPLGVDAKSLSRREPALAQ